MFQNDSFNNYVFRDSYEKFMTKHLQHYGFLTGKNRFLLHELEGYEKTHGYSPSEDSHSDTQEDPVCVKLLDRIRIPNTTQLVYNIFDDGRIIPQLKAPHNLHHDFVINLKQNPRWPVEMQVIPEKITHIRSVPLQKEPLYIQSGSESTPQPKGENTDSLVYDYSSFSGPFFIKSKFAPSTTDCDSVKPVLSEQLLESDETLIFESRFESGNLEKVYKVGPYEYELHLRTDMYTEKHTQWYYFRITNTKTNKLYRFTIVNLCKSDSLYNDGLMPLMYSEKDVQQSNKGWRRWGSNIIYYRNNRRYQTHKGTKYFYSLTWTCYLPHDRDTVFFSHCYPYTYSDLLQYIEKIKKDPLKSSYCRIKLLTYSLADNLSIVMTITNSFTDSELEKRKKVIVITGRVHPGETNASWMMEGVLDYLLDNNPDSKLLRDLFIFKIVPMINPDGVIVGNYRCSLAGRDLNRNYRTQLKSSYPIIASLRNMIDRILKEREILFYCDLHGHSKKHNIFIYGCNDQTDERELFLERTFPVLLNKNLPDKFDYRSCKFKMQKSKAGTGRIVFRNLGITHSFTIEASFCGSTLGATDKGNITQPFHFNTDDLKSMGQAICNSLLDFCDPDQKQVNEIIANISEDLTRKYILKIRARGENVDMTKISLADLSQLDLSDGDSSDDDQGSDSSDSNGLPAHYEYMDRQLRNSKKILTKHKDTNCQEKVKIKESESLKQSHFGSRCMSCFHLEKNSSNPNPNPNPNPKRKPTNTQLDKTKLTLLNSKTEMKNRDINEKVGFLRKVQTMDMMKKESPIDPIKRSYQELETTKVLLSYEGKSKYQDDSNKEIFNKHHEARLLKQDEPGLQRPSWKPSANVQDSLCIHKPIKLSAIQTFKSGLQSKNINKLRFSPLSDCEGNMKTAGMFSQRPLNSIKKRPSDFSN